MSIQDSTTNNLLFLLAAAPLGLGCIIVSDDTSDTTGADTGNPPTTGNTTTEATMGTDTTPPVTSDGTGTSSGGSESPESTDGSSGPDSTGADSTGGSTVDCAAYGAHAVKCAAPYSEYSESYCNYALEYQVMYSAECGVGYEDYIACLTALSCEEFNGLDRCPDQLAALMALGCPTVE
jgi:hypothetical protein